MIRPVPPKANDCGTNPDKDKARKFQAANKRIKELEKKNRELEELNEFLEETSARLWRLQDKHFTIISAIKTPPGSIRCLQMK